MARWRNRLSRIGCLVVLAYTTISGAAHPLSAATLNPTCEVASLLQAFTTATTNTVADTINLPAGCIYTFTTAATSNVDGATALPVIANQVPGLDLTVNGNGATLRRDSNAPPFRLLHVSYQAEALFRDLTIDQGRAPEGGGIAITWQAARVTISGVTFTNNQAIGLQAENGGGAIFAHETTLVVENSTFTENSTTADLQSSTGGAIKNLLSDLSIRDSTFTGNRTGNGGAVYIDGTNRATPNSIAISNSRFTNNQARNGGGIYACVYEANETLWLDSSTVANNTAVGGQGGGMVRNCAGQFHLSRSAIIGNSASQAGGIEIDNVVAVITNSTIANNLAVDTGGGIHLYHGQLTANNVTLVGNQAVYGGGIAGGDATSRLSNTIMHNRATNPYGTRFNCSGVHLSSGGGNVEFPGTSNDVNDRDCTLGALIGDPKVLELTQGNTPPVLPLDPTSPAINWGNPATCLGMDQRGYTRSGVCDSGAYEYNGALFVPTSLVFIPLINR